MMLNIFLLVVLFFCLGFFLVKININLKIRDIQITDFYKKICLVTFFVLPFTLMFFCLKKNEIPKDELATTIISFLFFIIIIPAISLFKKSGDNIENS